MTIEGGPGHIIQEQGQIRYSHTTQGEGPEDAYPDRIQYKRDILCIAHKHTGESLRPGLIEIESSVSLSVIFSKMIR
jgi:hypothetical protein